MLKDPSLDTWLFAVTSPYKYSMQRYDGDGFQTTWELNFASGYISRDHVKGYLKDNSTGAITDLVIDTVNDFINDNTVRVLPAVPHGVTLVLYRDTPKDGPMVNFTDGAVINEENLDTVTRQSIFTAAEMVDRFSEVNVLSQEATQNALLALSTANAANAKADQAITDSANAVLVADSAQGIAQNANQYALDALSTATNANTEATNAVNTANAASSTANGANSTANSAINIAYTADSNATTAINTSNNALTIANEAKVIAQAASDKVDTVDTALAEAQAAAGTATGAANSAAASKDQAQEILNEINDTIGDLVSNTAIDAAIVAHEAKPDPHPQYVLEEELGGLDFIPKNSLDRQYCNLPAGFAVALYHLHPDFDNEPDNPKFDYIVPAGQVLSTLEYPELYAVIGDVYATGTMEPNTFELPPALMQRSTIVQVPDASWLGVNFTGNVKQHTHNATTSSSGAHTHTANTSPAAGSNTTTVVRANGAIIQANNVVNSSGAHTHTITVANNATSSGIYNQPSGRGVMFAIALGRRISIDGPYA